MGCKSPCFRTSELEPPSFVMWLHSHGRPGGVVKYISWCSPADESRCPADAARLHGIVDLAAPPRNPSRWKDIGASLTHWSRDKMSDIFQMTFFRCVLLALFHLWFPQCLLSNPEENRDMMNPTNQVRIIRRHRHNKAQQHKIHNKIQWQW